MPNVGFEVRGLHRSPGFITVRQRSF